MILFQFLLESDGGDRYVNYTFDNINFGTRLMVSIQSLPAMDMRLVKKTVKTKGECNFYPISFYTDNNIRNFRITLRVTWRKFSLWLNWSAKLNFSSWLSQCRWNYFFMLPWGWFWNRFETLHILTDKCEVVVRVSPALNPLTAKFFLVFFFVLSWFFLCLFLCPFVLEVSIIQNTGR